MRECTSLRSLPSNAPFVPGWAELFDQPGFEAGDNIDRQAIPRCSVWNGGD